MNPDERALREKHWDLYGHFTLRDKWSRRDLNSGRFRAVLHLVESAHRLPKWSLGYFFALEDPTTHPHFHGLICGVPREILNSDFCRFVQEAWRRKRGGFARVTIFDPLKNGIAYGSKDTGKIENVDHGSPWYSHGLFGL